MLQEGNCWLSGWRRGRPLTPLRPRQKVFHRRPPLQVRLNAADEIVRRRGNGNALAGNVQPPFQAAPVDGGEALADKGCPQVAQVQVTGRRVRSCSLNMALASTSRGPSSPRGGSARRTSPLVVDQVGPSPRTASVMRKGAPRGGRKRWVKLEKFQVPQNSAGAVGQGQAVAGVLPGAGGAAVNLAATAAGQDDGAGLQQNLLPPL